MKTDEKKLPDNQPCFKYNSEYRIAICSVCKYGVPPRSVKRHFSDEHPVIAKKRKAEIKLFRQEREPHLAQVGDVVHPDQVCAPIEGILTHTRYVCPVGDCRFEGVARADYPNHHQTILKEMNRHCKNVHAMIKQQKWEGVPVQTIFKNPYIK